MSGFFSFNKIANHQLLGDYLVLLFFVCLFDCTDRSLVQKDGVLVCGNCLQSEERQKLKLDIANADVANANNVQSKGGENEELF